MSKSKQTDAQMIAAQAGGAGRKVRGRGAGSRSVQPRHLESGSGFEFGQGSAAVGDSKKRRELCASLLIRRLRDFPHLAYADHSLMEGFLDARTAL